jgi:hypothetical protein
MNDRAPNDSAPTPPADASAQPAAGKSLARAVFRTETARVDPSLDGRPLAARWQRLAGIAIDLGVVAALSVFTGPVLALGTGATIASLGGRDVSPLRVWAVVRWIFIFLGGGVMVAAVFLMLGRPLVRTGAFNLIHAAPAVSQTAAIDQLPLVPTKEDYRRVNAQLIAQVETLRTENAQLRANLRGSSWLNAASDFSRTFGLTFGWAGMYFTLCLAWLRGRTLGKFIVGTRVVRLDGKPLTTLDAFTRYGGYAAGLATGMIGFARLLWEPNRQAIQDKIAWTVVLRVR